MKKFALVLTIVSAALFCQGCKTVVKTAVGTAVGVGVAAVGTAASIGVSAATAVIP